MKAVVQERDEGDGGTEIDEHQVIAAQKKVLCQSSQQVLYLANEIEDDMGASAMSLDQNSLSILSVALRSFQAPAQVSAAGASAANYRASTPSFIQGG